MALPEAQRAVGILGRDFGDLDALGPRRVARFLYGGSDDELQAEVVAFVGELVEAVGGTDG